ncbi:hypothetical protein AALB19_11860 [Oscillospiraceae bacterium 50-58]
MITVPDPGGLCSTWTDREQFTYQGHSLELRYQTEPPHGDFLYSLTLSLNVAKYRLPLWVYGRSLFFFGPSLLLAESVPARSISNLKSVVIDLSSARYALLDSWYHQPQLTEQGLLLTGFHGGASLLLTPSTPLIWQKFYCEEVHP